MLLYLTVSLIILIYIKVIFRKFNFTHRREIVFALFYGYSRL
jgi:hypothetical protein